MEIYNYFEYGDQEKILADIDHCDWSAAHFLADLLRKGTFNDTLGGWGKLYILMDGDKLVSFLTLTGQDAVRDESLTPWIGFVYTKPEYRGNRYAGLLIARSEAEAAGMGYPKVYIASDHVGLYEKYGYAYQKTVWIAGAMICVFYISVYNSKNSPPSLGLEGFAIKVLPLAVPAELRQTWSSAHQSLLPHP
jgi:GNAT superfamily N-acetyltransferase